MLDFRWVSSVRLAVAMVMNHRLIGRSAPKVRIERSRAPLSGGSRGWLRGLAFRERSSAWREQPQESQPIIPAERPGAVARIGAKRDRLCAAGEADRHSALAPFYGTCPHTPSKVLIHLAASVALSL
jgi:hypothetical protein